MLQTTQFCWADTDPSEYVNHPLSLFGWRYLEAVSFLPSFIPQPGYLSLFLSLCLHLYKYNVASLSEDNYGLQTFELSLSNLLNELDSQQPVQV